MQTEAGYWLSNQFFWHWPKLGWPFRGFKGEFSKILGISPGLFRMHRYCLYSWKAHVILSSLCHTILLSKHAFYLRHRLIFQLTFLWPPSGGYRKRPLEWISQQICTFFEMMHIIMPSGKNTNASGCVDFLYSFVLLKGSRNFVHLVIRYSICSVLGKSHLGADHHFWVKTRFGILVESSFIGANQIMAKSHPSTKKWQK